MTIGNIYDWIKSLGGDAGTDLDIIIGDKRGVFEISSISLNHLVKENHTALMVNLKRLNTKSGNSNG